MKLSLIFASGYQLQLQNVINIDTTPVFADKLGLTQWCHCETQRRRIIETLCKATIYLRLILYGIKLVCAVIQQLKD